MAVRPEPARRPLTTIVPALEPAQRVEVQKLIDELNAWDLAESERLGVDVELVQKFYYEPERSDPFAHFEPPGGCFLLALEDGEVAGCIGYRRMTPDTCEMKHLWVRPAMRGHGIARALGERLIAEARRAGYRTIRLESASFMTGAHRLYEALGFVRCDPYYVIPAEFLPFTLFMERGLAPAPGDWSSPNR